MTNTTKWLIAVPFALSIAIAIPALAAGRMLWFLDRWPDLVFVSVTAGMWVLATAFVNPERSREPRSLARLLIMAGLILCVPVAVYDRTRGAADARSGLWSLAGIALCVIAAGLGIAARRVLGRFYAAEPTIMQCQELVTGGPYRLIRHPMYTAALVWACGWPLIIASFWGAVVALGFLAPALRHRIHEEEELLRTAFGQQYTEYMRRTWRLIPFLY
jgi:protein-S-isoprenylcysteine O-methyltransferase Ste14